jgi:UDP-2,3-diacylglucosamine pyrophosphatase LpxH
MLKSYPDFLKKQADIHQPDRIIHIGDLIDWNSISYHPKHPSLANPLREFTTALKQVKEISKVFPKADWLLGNHDSLPRRKALDALLPNNVLKNEAELWQLDWKVHERFTDLKIDNVIYRHGDKCGSSQISSAFLNAQKEHTSLVQGHFHAQAGVQYSQNSARRIFGMQVGCGTNHSHPNMMYAVKYTQKPIVGCGVVKSKSEAFFIAK